MLCYKQYLTTYILSRTSIKPTYGTDLQTDLQNHFIRLQLEFILRCSSLANYIFHDFCKYFAISTKNIVKSYYIL